MSEAKHTPGPWEAFANSWDVTCVYVEGEEICRCSINPLADEDSQAHFEAIKDANARLISAAPDLLDAAQAAWNCIGELPPTQARVESALMLQAAIAKATGAKS